VASYRLNIVFILLLFQNFNEIRSQHENRIVYSHRTTLSVFQGFGNENPNVLYSSKNQLTGYGLRVVNGIKYHSSETGLGIGVEKWDAMVFSLFLSQLYGFETSRFMPWLFIKADGGWAHGEMNPDSPYPAFRSDNAWFVAAGPGAKIKLNHKISILCGVQYEFHKQILKKEFRYNSVDGLHFVGVYLGFSFLNSW
jgi:hypothetical protein